MAYALENALDQWQEGERRVRAEPGLDAAARAVLEELRRRLGSSFELEELADLYGDDPDWATDLARSQGAGTRAPYAVDAAFARYARQSADYAGGRRRPRVGD